MKRWIGIILLGMSTHLSVQAQQAYVPSSQHLNDPDLFIPFVEESATFWYSAWDDARGGFYTNVARDGTPNRSWGTNKELLTQSRNAYAMVRAFQLTGNAFVRDHRDINHLDMIFSFNMEMSVILYSTRIRVNMTNQCIHAKAVYRR